MSTTTAPALVTVKRMADAQFAYCPTCDHWLGCQCWSLSKSVGLHKSGTGHSVTLYRYA